jgi:hypothetical protein
MGSCLLYLKGDASKMAKITGLKKKLTSVNLYPPEVWKEAKIQYPSCEIGYIRAYHDGHSWSSTSFPLAKVFASGELIKEFSNVFDAFVRSFKDLNAMSKWCREYAQPTSDPTVFNAWFSGKEGIYYLRMITRRGDYNLYLHCLDRKAIKEVTDHA